MNDFQDLVSKIQREALDRHPELKRSLLLNESADNLTQLCNSWEDRGVDMFAADSNGGDITLHSLIVPKGRRKQGLGTEAMTSLAAYADQHGQRVILTVGQRDDHHGTTSSSRLRKFYKRFGFVENKGRNKDYRISASMYREPK